VQCWESVIESTVAAVTFRERKPSVDKEPQYMRLLTQCADSEREGEHFVLRHVFSGLKDHALFVFFGGCFCWWVLMG